MNDCHVSTALFEVGNDGFVGGSRLAAPPAGKAAILLLPPRTGHSKNGNIADSPRSAPANPLRELLQWGNPMSLALKSQVTDI